MKFKFSAIYEDEKYWNFSTEEFQDKLTEECLVATNLIGMQWIGEKSKIINLELEEK